MRYALRRSFSLIELLISLSVLAVVAAIIIPRFIGIQGQAQQTVITNDLAEISHAAAEWQATGGTYNPAVEVTPVLLAFHLVEFLSTPSNGQPDRGMRFGAHPIDPGNSLTDSGTSSSIVIGAYVATDPVNHPNDPQNIPPASSSDKDGIYGKKPAIAMTPSNAIYEKKNAQVYQVDFDPASFTYSQTPGAAPGTLSH